MKGVGWGAAVWCGVGVGGDDRRAVTGGRRGEGGMRWLGGGQGVVVGE